MIDPRPGLIERRLAGVGRILAVTGGKGGIGKTLVATALAAVLARAGRHSGLLDLDFTGPCGHIVLGAETAFPREDAGIQPQEVAGVRFLSIACFAGEQPAPLRGAEASNALIELLAITRWGELGTLVIDMPPGIGDPALDTVRLLPRAEFLVVASRSRLVVDTVRRTLTLLRRLERTVIGLVENLAPDGATPDGAAPDGAGGDPVAALALEFGTRLLGRLPRDPAVEETLGRPRALLATAFGRAVAGVADREISSRRT